MLLTLIFKVTDDIFMLFVIFILTLIFKVINVILMLNVIFIYVSGVHTCESNCTHA